MEDLLTLARTFPGFRKGRRDSAWKDSTLRECGWCRVTLDVRGSLDSLADTKATTGISIVLNWSGESCRDLKCGTLRRYGWNGEASAGTCGLSGAITFPGSLPAIPKPGTALLCGLGFRMLLRCRR